ncbi:MAG: hypothetical protein ACOX7P_02235 [Oscillospiraceae bacterium]
MTYQATIVTGGTAGERSKKAEALAAARLGVTPHIPHPDITIVRPLKDKSSILIDQCRSVRSEAYVRPNQADERAFIIDGPMEARTQNVLLKILEEPPASAFFIITAQSISDLLPTVRSRCAAVRLPSARPEPTDRAAQLLSLIRANDKWELGLFWKKQEKLKRDEFFDFIDEVCQTILNEAGGAPAPELKLVPRLRLLRSYYEYNTGVGLLCGLALVYCWEVKI